MKQDKLNVIDNNYLRGIESLYTWKILVLERLRSGLYSYTLPNVSKMNYELMHRKLYELIQRKLYELIQRKLYELTYRKLYEPIHRKLTIS